FTSDFFGTTTNAGTIDIYSHWSVFGTLTNNGLVECIGGLTFPSPYSSVATYIQPVGNNANYGTIEAITGGEIDFNITNAAGPTTFTNYGTIEAFGGSIIAIG